MTKMIVAFICTHNACRSQIAEALAKHGLSKKVGGEAQNLGGDFGGESVLSLGETLGERP